jgi:hypothetical protein
LLVFFRLILRRQGCVAAVLVGWGASKRFTPRETGNLECGALDLIVLRWADMLGAARCIIRSHWKQCQMMLFSQCGMNHDVREGHTEKVTKGRIQGRFTGKH